MRWRRARAWPPLPINLNEYAARYQLTNPDQMVVAGRAGRTKVDGDLPYWNINGTLGDSTAQQNVPNGQWWLYNWYSQLSGDTVQVTPSQDNPDYTMQGLATLDRAQRQARVIMGGGPPGTTTWWSSTSTRRSSAAPCTPRSCRTAGAG